MPQASDDCLVSLYTGIYRVCLLSNREKSQTIWNKFLGLVTLFLKEMQYYETFDFVMKFQSSYLGALFQLPLRDNATQELWKLRN